MAQLNPSRALLVLPMPSVDAPTNQLLLFSMWFFLKYSSNSTKLSSIQFFFNNKYLNSNSALSALSSKNIMSSNTFYLASFFNFFLMFSRMCWAQFNWVAL